MKYVFSDRISALKPSAIREILKVTSGGNVIPFAAGNPAPEVFPADVIENIASKILRQQPVTALQYGVTEGYLPLRERISEDLKARFNIGREFDEIIITAGAQQVVDLAAKVFLNEGDTVICESPSFIGSLNCFRSYNACLKGIPVESDGMDIELLEKALETEKNVKMIYTIPNFQNPSGYTMSLEKRKALYELALKHNVIILEDNPYGELRYTGEDLPSIKSFDDEGIVIYAGSFSKVLSPGLRVGYSVSPAEITAKMTVGKQASDVHSPMICQMIVDRWLAECDTAEHIGFIRSVYSRKLNLMCDCLDSEISGFISYVRPLGGLFIWCELDRNINMLDFCKAAAAENVAVVPGTAFMASESDRTNCFRLNFSTPTDEQIVEGVKILKKVCEKF
ncbi:MAG: PLP-dependent aminotransferase family protein [Clostridiales bacterium]|jgi:2-aminoadipate transaminase|nr:PLP-dependent aminotransferase family protein [Clostridiales bacterium]HOA34600.1 PLP-dependent aminotransferase family protein [Clostridiales bacterium]HOJ35812.1 PLP-dependent aminotransferase family protein [Clostridiales bacterium]HOL79242.1 PLP-dependent aminotransferase family protein [Clostridiales bacterium]HPP68448.1 PLP-dependent aminotransferase family protein [Clostridiales bacterium]